ncbi:hypothetical protein RhiirA5_415804 [Rhizophagus irregularis]|uniref:Uncharacterized protein n=1 Tax=Rhizophagus irregularis TaxID=588596 RepID=A0A2I1FMM8_9GLOM|nr:hypothetical protein RhiirA5_415804 [Rhizophagus irregularis]PKY35624.1 hypothetical protein RhiirB3_456702 [Rhizophagus irregularis]
MQFLFKLMLFSGFISNKTRTKPTCSRAAHITSVQPQDPPLSHLRMNNSPSDGSNSRAHHPWSLAPPSTHPITTSALPMCSTFSLDSPFTT